MAPMHRIGFCLFMLAACGDDDNKGPSALGGGCGTTADCQPGLSCEFAFCQTPCTTDADCSGSARCVRGVVIDDAGTSGYVCQLPDDTTCKVASQCQGKQVCGGGECRDTCSDDTDCTTGQQCIGGAVCASRDPAKDNVTNGALVP